MIKLYYVRGINRFDTPYFPTIYAQEDYFENKLVSIMSDSFYPPHYTNKINISIEDLSFNSQINYLSIDFQGKTYYYFIDQIRYVTEDLMELSITMDTIQTYMFNIDFISSEVGRKLINRWNDDTINRNYIRENISNGEFILKEYVNYFTNKPLCLIFKYIDDTRFTELKNDIVPRTIEGTTLGILIIPNSSYSSLKYSIGTQVTTIDSNNVTQVIQNLLKNPKVLDVFITNFDVLPDISTSYSTTNREYTYSFNNNSYWYAPFAYGGSEIMLPIIRNSTSNFNVGAIFYNYIFNFEKNTSKDTPFLMNFVPQLLDNNYIEFNWGEKYDTTKYPLEKALDTSFKLLYGIDLFTNTRIYTIFENNIITNLDLSTTKYNDDVYNTTINVSTSTSYSLISDKWLEFQAFNYGFDRLRQAEYDRNMSTGVYAGLSQVFMKGPHQVGSGIMNAMASNTGKAGMYAAIAKGVGDTINTTSDIVASTAIEAKYINEVTLATKENAQYAPSNLKSNNSPNTSFMNKLLNVTVSTYMVEDINDVAKNFEGYGYKVHEQYSNTNLFKELNTRYYFNIIQCDKLNITLVDIISDEYTIYNITNRFNVGLRLWNVENGDIGEYLYIYDNVEKDYL